MRTSAMGVAAAAAGTGLRARAALEPAPVFILIFARGGMDGLSLMVPNAGVGRARYELWRPPSGSIHIPLSSTTAPDRGLALGASGFDTHPAMAPLVSGAGAPFNLGHLAFVGGVAGPVENRSHFAQMDLIETGSNTTVPLSSGYLSRALEVLGLEEEPLAGIAMNPLVPLSLRGELAQGVSVVDFDGFGTLGTANFSNDPTWRVAERLTNLNSVATCSSTNPTCAAAGLGVGAMDQVEALGTISPLGSDSLGASLRQLAEVIDAADTGQLRICTFDVGGWDTHTGQAPALEDLLGYLAGALREFYDEAAARGILDRVTLVCHSEFGRRGDENGTGGTDHGYGGTALVMDTHLRDTVVTTGYGGDRYFPNAAGSAFYAGMAADGVGDVLPKVLDVRQVLGEVLRHRLGVPNLELDGAAATVFPDFDFRPGARRVLDVLP